MNTSSAKNAGKQSDSLGFGPVLIRGGRPTSFSWSQPGNHFAFADDGNGGWGGEVSGVLCLSLGPTRDAVELDGCMARIDTSLRRKPQRGSLSRRVLGLR